MRFIAISVGKSVVTHISKTKSSVLGNGADSATKCNLLPAAIQKPIVMRVADVSSYKIGPRSFLIVPNNICKGRLK